MSAVDMSIVILLYSQPQNRIIYIIHDYIDRNIFFHNIVLIWLISTKSVPASYLICKIALLELGYNSAI